MADFPSRAVIFDSWPGKLELDNNPGQCLIALTPLCAHELQIRGLTYYIPEDFCSLKKQALQSDAFYLLFKNWVNFLNSHFRKYLSGILPPGMNPILPFAFHLHCIVDPWFTQSFVLDRVFQSLRGMGVAEIHWFGSSQGVSLKDISPKDGVFFPTWQGGSLYSTFAAALAEKYGLQFHFQETGAGPLNKNRIASLRGRITLNKVWNRFKSEWARLPLVRDQLINLHPPTQKIIYSFERQLPHSLIKRFRRNQFTIREIILENIPVEPQKINEDILPNSWQIFSEFNKVPLPDNFQKVFNQFLEFCVQAMVQISRDLDKENISPNSIIFSQDYTSFPYNCVNEYFRVKGIPRATLFHGDSFYCCNYWDIGEMQYADIYLVTNSIYLKTLTELYENIKYLVTDVRYGKIKRIKNTAGLSHKKLRKRVLYLPTIFREADLRFFKNAVDYPPTWYYKVQKIIIEHLLKQDFEVIYKAFPWHMARNPFLQPRDGIEHANLTISKEPFIEHFGTFDLMIADLPSTGMLECIYAGIPCASIYPEELIISKYAGHLIDKVLFPFNQMEEIPGLLEKILAKTDQELLEPVKDIFPLADEIREEREKEIIRYFERLHEERSHGN
jgi:hypothetical protein